MRHRWFSLLGALMLIALLVTPAAAHSQHFDALQPGKFVTLKQTIPVNLVFIGYNGIKPDKVRAELPKTYDPVVRYPQSYGLNGRDLGLHYDFKYRFINTNSQFENTFFNYLAHAGATGPLTAFQQQYNDQQKNVLDVAANVRYIDGPSVEAWLEKQSGALNIDLAHSYTIYYINWYSRKDFQFHVYTKTDEPDPDTQYNFGALRASRKMIAWGGSSGRTWFYDLSAGPEAWTNNYIVDTPDLDGNGVEDYRMPPIWEYSKKGYRDPGKLNSDLGKVARFVAINLLFTSSPLYDPLYTAPGVGGKKIVYTTLFEDDPTSQGTDWFNRRYTLDKLRSFEPYYDWEVRLKDRKLNDGAERAFRIWANLLPEDDCWNTYGTTFAELFCYFTANRAKYVPAFGANDYVGAIYGFNTTDANMNDQAGLLGFADDNWTDGTQSVTFMFDTPDDRAGGFGFTTTAIHEFGHHIGMSHPHDGYDSELGLDYNPADAYEFAWSGDESNSIMQYIAVSNGFGQFDRDNMYRWETAGYLNWSNAIVGDIQASGKASQVDNLLQSADNDAKDALKAFDKWDYLSAVTHARAAYESVGRAAAKLGIALPTRDSALRALPGAIPLHQGDPIRFPDD